MFALLLVLGIAHAEIKLPKKVTWTLAVRKGDDKISEEKLEFKKTAIPLPGLQWDCHFNPDPQGDQAKASIGCIMGDDIVVLPAFCLPGVNQIYALNLGRRPLIYGVALTCEAGNSRAPKTK